jgi:hypothetical protein
MDETADARRAAVIGQRFALDLPGGLTVTVTLTAEMVALAERVQAAFDSGEPPQHADLLRLFAYLAEDS